MVQTPMARERLFALREEIARLEGSSIAAARQEALAGESGEGKRRESHRFPLGVPSLDAALEGGLPLNGMSEIRSQLMRDATAATGFALALAALLQREAGEDRSPVLWISDTVTSMETGIPYALGLADFGLKPERFLHAVPRRLEEALWLAETAVESGAFSVSILEVKGNPAHFGLTESRRLGLRAKAAGRPLLIVRQSGEEEASSAPFRFLVEPAPATSRFLPDRSILGGSIGNPVFRLTLEKSRNPAPVSLLLEWNPHDRQFLPLREPEFARSPAEFAAHPGPRLPASANRPDLPQKLGSVLALDRAS
jgi:protein ImuA